MVHLGVVDKLRILGRTFQYEVERDTRRLDVGCTKLYALDAPMLL